MAYEAAEERYDRMVYRFCGRSGLALPTLSLGLWHNFGDPTPGETQRTILRTAFDLGITHFDLANNYGPPYGAAERNFGKILKKDFAPYRDELLISTKAGWDMWPGPYGQGGGSRKYLLASLDQSLGRLGLDYVDIFYSHRFDPDSPLEETMGALATAVHQGKALYAGISSYSPGMTQRGGADHARDGCPAADPSTVVQHAEPLDRGRSARRVGGGGDGLHRVLSARARRADRQVPEGDPGGCADQPAGRRLAPAIHLSEENLAHVGALNEIAKARGQSLAQMALAWTLRDPRVTSALIGASRPEQVIENVGALENLEFTSEELAAIDAHAQEGDLNLWKRPSQDERP